eukprot:CAMPEP_0197522506 /NCGR_PEP_ID=MMETSP1318-20131121/7635_1 /TAXON_ID=552666 /ORGANISM="Partenskyella glossopodia, Strain RCC365" /LENGTH=450 /DNA_ID=CAMNT_0043074905 /DNA_START=3 /DNA_END=1355 /DNA_ORIENTATION=+
MALKFKISAQDLPNVDINGLSDPYLVLTQNNKIIYQSEVVQDNLSPSWQPFGVLMQIIDHKQAITFQVYDYDLVEKDELLGQVQIGVNQLKLLAKNSLIDLADEVGHHVGELGKLKLHFVALSRTASDSLREGRSVAERPSPYLVSVLGRERTGGKIFYTLRVIAPLADARKPLEWHVQRKFGQMHKFNDAIKPFLLEFKGQLEEFPPRPRALFGHSKKFLDERQKALNSYWNALCRCIPDKSKLDSTNLKKLRKEFFLFLEVKIHMDKFKVARNAEVREIKRREADKKLMERRKELKEKKDKQYRSVREKVGLPEKWKMQKSTAVSHEVRAIDGLTLYFSSCPGNTKSRKYTINLVNLFTALQIKFEAKDVSMSRKTREYMLANSQPQNKRCTPQIFKNGKFLALWPQLKQLHEEEKLIHFLLAGGEDVGHREKRASTAYKSAESLWDK